MTDIASSADVNAKNRKKRMKKTLILRIARNNNWNEAKLNQKLKDNGYNPIYVSNNNSSSDIKQVIEDKPKIKRSNTKKQSYNNSKSKLMCVRVNNDLFARIKTHKNKSKAICEALKYYLDDLDAKGNTFPKIKREVDDNYCID